MMNKRRYLQKKTKNTRNWIDLSNSYALKQKRYFSTQNVMTLRKWWFVLPKECRLIGEATGKRKYSCCISNQNWERAVTPWFERQTSFSRKTNYLFGGCMLFPFTVTIREILKLWTENFRWTNFAWRNWEFLEKDEARQATGEVRITVDFIVDFWDPAFDFSSCSSIYEEREFLGELWKRTFMFLPKKPRTQGCKDFRTFALMGHVTKFSLSVIKRERERVKKHFLWKPLRNLTRQGHPKCNLCFQDSGWTLWWFERQSILLS